MQGKLFEYVDEINRDIKKRNLWISQFLDDFRRTHSKALKYFMVKDEPDFKGDLSLGSQIAAIVESLCNGDGVLKPKWIYHDKYYNTIPIFSQDVTDDFRTHYLITSPVEFKLRNIFIGQNQLTRC